MRKIIVAVFLILFLSAFPSFAQDSSRVVLNENLVPKEGAKLTDFVPKGWKIEEELRGHLHADSGADIVLQLIEDKPEENSKGELQDRYRALVILFMTPDGKYRRVAVAGKLIQCPKCGGVLGSADLKIVKGVLLVSQLSGSRWATDHLRRFRYDVKTGRFLLIGEDIKEWDRATGNSVVTSINYFTGQKVIEKKQYNQKTDKDVTLGKQRKLVEKKQIPIEEIDYEK
ncbi:MAG: hypothetical protein WC405_10745 [Syntrophales bacterium]